MHRNLNDDDALRKLTHSRVSANNDMMRRIFKKEYIFYLNPHMADSYQYRAIYQQR